MKDLKTKRGIITDCFIYVIFITMPLFYTDLYFNISSDKWAFFTIASIIYVFLILALLLLDKTPESSVWFDHLGLIEWTAVVFIATQILSTLLSVDKGESFIGASSRHHGLANYVIYILLLFIIRKQDINPKRLMPLLAFIGGFEGVFSTLQFLTFDLLGMYTGARKDSVLSFISTIGNINFFAGFLTMTTPLSIYLFISEKRVRMQIIYGICMVSQFAGGLACGADSFYLGLFAGLFIMVFAGGLKLREYRRLPFALMLAGICDHILSKVSSGLRDKQYVFSASLKENGAGPISVRNLSGITAKLADLNFLRTFIFAMAAVYAIMVVVCELFPEKEEEHEAEIQAKSKEDAGSETRTDTKESTAIGSNSDLPGNRFKIKNPQGIIVLSVCGAILLAAMILVFVKPPFNDDFGTHRGFVWKLGIKDYKSMPLYRKIIGYGQETVLGVFNGKYYDYMVSHQNVVYDNVHCEPLQYLITTGILGLAAYLTFIGSVLTSLINRVKSDRSMNLFLIPVFSYFIQSYVNIAQTAGTSIFFLIIALGLNHMRTIDHTRTENHTGTDKKADA